MSNKSKFANLVKSLQQDRAELRRVVPFCLAEVTSKLYWNVISETPVDTGQGLNQWYVLPGETGMTLPLQEIQWGTKTQPPIPPVEWKYRKKGERELSVELLIDFKLQFYASTFDYISNNQFNTVKLYNPITSGFFEDDENYADTVFELVEEQRGTLFVESLENGYKATIQTFPKFFKRKT